MTRVPRWADRMLVPLLFLALALATAVATARPGESATVPAGPVTVTATPTEGLADGQVVNIHAEAPAGSQLFEVRAHLCQHDAGIDNTTEFGFQGPYCPNGAIGAGQYDEGVQLGPGTREADLSFAVGIGGVTWVDEQSYVHDLTCGPGAPCDLVVLIQIPNDTVYATFPLLIGEGAAFAPPPPPPPAAATDNPPAAGDTQAPATATPSAASAEQPAHSGAATGGSKSGGASAAGGTGESTDAATGSDPSSTNASQDGSEITTASEAAAISPADVSRGMRVFSGGVAGLIGGALIVLIVVRARRRMSTTGAM